MHVNRETDTHRAIVGFGDCCRRIRPNREARLFMSKRRQYFDTDVEARQRCVFRRMPGCSSGASRAGIPVHAGPPFRLMPGWV
jgi:hypothetical protein